MGCCSNRKPCDNPAQPLVRTDPVIIIRQETYVIGDTPQTTVVRNVDTASLDLDACFDPSEHGSVKNAHVRRFGRMNSVQLPTLSN